MFPQSECQSDNGYMEDDNSECVVVVKDEPLHDTGESKHVRNLDTGRLLPHEDTFSAVERATKISPHEDIFSTAMDVKADIIQPSTETGNTDALKFSSAIGTVVKSENQSSVNIKAESNRDRSFLDIFMHIDPTFDSIDKFISNKLENGPECFEITQCVQSQKTTCSSLGYYDENEDTVTNAFKDGSQSDNHLSNDSCHSDTSAVRDLCNTGIHSFVNQHESTSSLETSNDKTDALRNPDNYNCETDKENAYPDTPKIEIDVDVSDNDYTSILDRKLMRRYRIRQCFVALNGTNHRTGREIEHQNDNSISGSECFDESNSSQIDSDGSAINTLNDEEIFNNALDDIDFNGQDADSVNETITSVESQSFAGSDLTFDSIYTSDQPAEHERILGYSESELQCPVCFKRFKARKTMQNHKAKAHGNRVYHCDRCDKWFATRRPFDDHVRGHLNIRPYKCSRCSKSFTAYKYLYFHAKTHTEDSEKKYSCSYCTKRFVRRKHLESHIRMHTNEKPFKCSDCDKAYKYEPQLRIHRRLHTGQRFYCEVCKWPFVDKSDLKRHASVHSGLRAYKCDTCGAAFRQKGTLNKHVLLHTVPSKFEKKECNVCGQIFKCQSYLTKHMEIHDPDRPSFKCYSCGEVLASKGTLRYHIKNTCKSLEYPEFLCDICGKYLKTKDNLQKHKKNHTDGWKFPCRQCDRSFPYLNLLQLHIKKDHEHIPVRRNGTKCKFCKTIIVDMEMHLVKHHTITKNKFECSTCGKIFKHKQHLKVHENIHRDIKQYRCDTCQRTFAQKGDLNSHIKCMHVADAKPLKPTKAERGTRCRICRGIFVDMEAHMKKRHENPDMFICTVCNKRLKSVSDLNSHAAIHLDYNSRKWKCNICQYRFVTKSALKTHIRRKHVS